MRQHWDGWTTKTFKLVTVAKHTMTSLARSRNLGCLRYASHDGMEVISLSDSVHQNRSTEALIGVTALLDVRSYSIMLITACYASLYVFWALYTVCN
jgi:hypothetical protein